MLPRLFASSWSPSVLLLALLATVAAQSSPTSTSSTSSTLSASLSLTTGSATVITNIRNGSTLLPVSTVVPVVFNVTVTPTPTSSASPSATSTAPPDPRRLDTQLDPAFGVLGAILILTGIPSAFLGHKNRWTSFFLIGFYTLSLVCFALILRFGVLEAVNPPSKTIRGLFVLACGVAGVTGGGVTIFFWKATKYFIGAWGGLAFGFWIQCFREGGLIHSIGLRWLMFLGCATVGFTLCTIPKLHYYILILSTAFVGATSFMLGVDCFSTAGVKEFYIWNLGFNSLFERYVDLGIQFPVTQTMEIELGLLGAVAIMGIALQLRILPILQRKLDEIKAEQARLDEEQEARAAEQFARLEHEKAEWEREHPTLLKHGRQDSVASTALLKDSETAVGSPSSAGADEKLDTAGRPRYHSGVSTLMLSTPVDGKQSPGALPALDLGLDLENDVPKNYLSPEMSRSPEVRAARNSTGTMSLLADLEDLKKKEELLNEIHNIRKSIEVLKSETPTPSSTDGSRRQSFSSRRTLSHDFGSFLPTAGGSNLRPRQADTDARTRVHSMDLLNNRESVADAIGRPTSVPLQNTTDADWQAYLRERKLLQPPSGVSPPISTTPVALASPKPRLAVSPAITNALSQRQRRESSLSFGRLSPVVAPESPQLPEHRHSASKERSSDDIPIALRPQLHKKSDSQGSYAPGIILPPKNRGGSSPQPHAQPSRPDPARVMSFEELDGRHRERLRQLQQPITKAEKEQAEVQAARGRWERARQLEKQAVLKRQAEKAAVVSKKEKEEKKASGRNSISLNDNPKRPHSRSLSADVLAREKQLQGSLSSRRMTVTKVEDWQKTQLDDLERGVRPRAEPSSRRLSGVPFPADGTGSGRPSRESRRFSGQMLQRDSPN